MNFPPFKKLELHQRTETITDIKTTLFMNNEQSSLVDAWNKFETQ